MVDRKKRSKRGEFIETLDRMAAQKSNMGRPRLYDDTEQGVAEFVDAIDDYLRTASLKNPPTIAGLCIALGMTHETFNQYAKKTNFSEAIKIARLFIEEDRASRLARRDAYTPGLVVDLVHNHNWKDRRQMEHSGHVNFANLSDEELKAKYDELAGALAAGTSDADS